MPSDAIVRLSLQTGGVPNNPDYQAARNQVHQALTGVGNYSQVGNGPFVRVNTFCYVANGADDQAVFQALQQLSQACTAHLTLIDFCSVSVTKVDLNPQI